MPPSKLDYTRTQFLTALDGIGEAGTRYRAVRDTTRQDPNLTDVGKAEAITAHKATAQEAIKARQAAALEALIDYQVALEMTANPPSPSGIEGVAARIEAVDARSRVRALLAEGVAPNAIIDRATSGGDLLTLDALRAEAPWMNPVGNVPPDGLIARIDDARAELLPEEQGAAIRELAQFTSRRDAYVARIRRASGELESGSTLGGAIADRYAGITTASEPAASEGGE